MAHLVKSNQFNLFQSMRFWTRQSLTDCRDKGGSFDLDLYMRYLEAISDNNNSIQIKSI